MASVIEEIRGLLGEYWASKRAQSMGDMTPATPPSGHVVQPQAAGVIEPIRTVHHMACTGGTVISKCIAAMPNVVLLSEVDPLSPLVSRGTAPKFAPTDITAQLRWSTRTIDRETLVALFQAQVTSLSASLVQRGQHLVIRDHAHSHFCTGPEVPDRPSLRTMVGAIAPVRSIVTVRNPFDSFASLLSNKWATHFSPSTFDEYCRRYHVFLDHHRGLPVFRYEDVAAQPAQHLQTICHDLDLAFAPSFSETFSAFALSGDSGRRSDVFQPAPRREAALELETKHGRLGIVNELLQRLGYRGCT